MNENTSQGPISREHMSELLSAAGELYIEITSDYKILKTSGELKTFSFSQLSNTKLQQSLLDYVAEEDREYITLLIKKWPAGERINPRKILLLSSDKKKIPSLMSAFKSQDKKKITIVLSRSHWVESPRGADDNQYKGLLDRFFFTEKAKECLYSIIHLDQEYKITFLAYDHSELSKKLTEEDLEKFENSLSSLLRVYSIAGQEAAYFQKGRFALLHYPNHFYHEFKDDLDNLFSKFNVQNNFFQTYTLDLNTGSLDIADASRALLYSIEKFIASQQQIFQIANLTESAKKVLDETLTRVHNLRQTIEKKSFDIVFQPIITFSDQQVHHYEALVRLTRMGSPSKVIPFAEQIGMVEDFDLAVCQKVLENITSLAKQDLHPIIAVNISAKSLESHIFISELKNIINPYSEYKSQLMFEITETSQIKDFKRSNETIQNLRKEGHKICLDDVGSGTTSFQSLYNLEVDYAKIDGQCIRSTAVDQRQFSILKSIVSVCKELNIKMVAEQVETKYEDKVVQELGIQLGQGYYYGEPISSSLFFSYAGQENHADHPIKG